MMPDEKNVTPDHTAADEDAAPAYRGLKALVIGLGLGIVAMLGLIFYTIGERAAESLLAEEGAPPPATVAAVEPVATTAMADLEVARPEGGRLVASSVAGNDLLLHFRTAAGDILIIVNRTTGEQTRVRITD